MMTAGSKEMVHGIVGGVSRFFAATWQCFLAVCSPIVGRHPSLYAWRGAATHHFGMGRAGSTLQHACMGFGSLPGMIPSLGTVPRKGDELVQTTELVSQFIDLSLSMVRDMKKDLSTPAHQPGQVPSGCP